MSALEDYDRRCGRAPLTREQVDDQVDGSRGFLETADKATAVELRRVLVWLADRVVALEAELATAQGDERPTPTPLPGPPGRRDS